MTLWPEGLRSHSSLFGALCLECSRCVAQRAFGHAIQKMLRSSELSVRSPLHGVQPHTQVRRVYGGGAQQLPVPMGLRGIIQQLCRDVLAVCMDGFTPPANDQRPADRRASCPRTATSWVGRSVAAAAGAGRWFKPPDAALGTFWPTPCLRASPSKGGGNRCH